MLSSSRLAKVERRVQARRSTATLPLLAPSNIMEFATYSLGVSSFPRQGTILKVVTLSTGLITSYDEGVLDEWSRGYRLERDGNRAGWVGEHGMPGDVFERMAWCQRAERPWFREVLLIVGRRGGKGILGAILCLWSVRRLLGLPDGPHAHYNIDPGKRLVIPIVAGKQTQAKGNQFADVRALALRSEELRPYLASETADALCFYTREQVESGVRDPSRALIAIVAGATAESSVRGFATPTVILDEFAHVLGAGATVDSTRLYEAATPALATFTSSSLSLQTSSPWDRSGQLFASYERTLRVDPDTQVPTDPDMILFQLESWDPYVDGRVGDTIPMWPGGPCYERREPILEYNDELSRHEAANPDSFEVEYRSHFRSSQTPYFPHAFVARVFAPFNGRTLEQQTEGGLATIYAAHGDPSLSQANFGFTIAHLEPDADGIPHVLFDRLHAWLPSDFGGIMDYIQVEDEIFDLNVRFGFSDLTFDHWNSAGSIQRLQARVDRAGLPVRTRVFERRPDAAYNWQAYETFKTAIGHNIIHAPAHPLARAELEALQLVNGKIKTLTSGPTRTKDIVDAMVNTTWTLIGDDASAIFERLARLQPRGADLNIPAPIERYQDPVHQALGRFGRTRSAPGAQRGPVHDPARGRRGFRQ